MRRWIVAFAAVSVTPFVTAQEQIPPALQALVDTERAFARAATVKGQRDSFLDFVSRGKSSAPRAGRDRTRTRGRLQ